MSALIPVYDLHRHLGGSIRPEIVWDLIKKSGDDTAKSLEHVYEVMTYRADIGPRTFYRFLGKFEILDEVEWTRSSLNDILRSTVKDIRREGVKYAELRFSMDKYMKYMDVEPQELVAIIYGTVARIAEHNGIDVRLILALKFESDKELQKKQADIILNSDIAAMVDGLDGIGDEGRFDCGFYKPIFKQWRDAGKMLTIHVGESQTSENIFKAIEGLNVHRIGHGIKIIDHPDLIDLAIERDICFEVSLTSNWITGVVENMEDHPARQMFDAGLAMVLCTDDPSIFGTTMNQEITIARMCLNFSDAEIDTMKRNAIKYSAKNIIGQP